jgi:hypothetical protein
MTWWPYDETATYVPRLAGRFQPVVHYFHKQDLDDPEMVWVTPQCMEGQPYPSQFHKDLIQKKVGSGWCRWPGCTGKEPGDGLVDL